MKTGPKPTLLTEELEAEVEKWYHQWLNERNKKGEVVTINILDMLKDFAAEKQSLVVDEISQWKDVVYQVHAMSSSESVSTIIDELQKYYTIQKIK